MRGLVDAECFAWAGSSRSSIDQRVGVDQPNLLSDAKSFFHAWVAQAFGAEVPWTDLYPTPLGALEALRAAGAEAGFGEQELRAAVGDLIPALMQAMLDAPAPAVHDSPATPGDLAAAKGRVMAMGLALSYLDGLRATVGHDIEAAAELVLYHLTRQGFVLRAADGMPDPELYGKPVGRPFDFRFDDVVPEGR